jgi:hypothetical protein
MNPFPVDGDCYYDEAHQFSNRLRTSLEDLRSSVPALLDRLRRCISDAFALNGSFDEVRTTLAARAKSILVSATESRLKAFCLRCTDLTSPDDPWIESIGSLLALQPPTRWHDSNEDTFERELADVAVRFRNLESITFGQNGFEQFAEAFKVSLTRSDGTEASQVVYLHKGQLNAVEAAAEQIQQIVDQNRTVGVAALSRAVWAVLSRG